MFFAACIARSIQRHGCCRIKLQLVSEISQVYLSERLVVVQVV
jgi:hypothetical protein